MEINLGNVLKVIAAGAAALWGGLEPMVQLLILLMAVDIVTGFLAGWYDKKLDSVIAFRGVLKKGLILCLVVVASLVQYYAAAQVGLEPGQIPLSAALAGFFSASEALSSLENAARAGVPIPDFLRAALAKLNPTRD